MVSANLIDSWRATQLSPLEGFDELELRDPSTCPRELLPLLATEATAWTWNPLLGEVYERASITDAWLLSAYRFTPGAIRRYTRNLGVTVRWEFTLAGTRRSMVTVYVSAVVFSGIDQTEWMRRMFGLLFRVPVEDVFVANVVSQSVRVHAFGEGMMFGPRERVSLT